MCFRCCFSWWFLFFQTSLLQFIVSCPSSNGGLSRSCGGGKRNLVSLKLPSEWRAFPCLPGKPMEDARLEDEAFV